MSWSWTDQVAVVSGAAGALGGAVTAELLARGSRVVGLDVGPALERLEADPSIDRERFFGLPVDLKNRDSIVDAFTQVDKRFGDVTMLANFAGVSSPPHGVAECTEDEWDHIMDVNLAGSFWTCQQALQRMMPARRGSIVNISSLNGLLARRAFHSHIYAVSKAGLIGLSRTLAAEAGEAGIRVNTVAPGLHRSPMASQGTASREAAEAYTAAYIADSPLHRVAEPDDIVGPTLFFLGPDSSNVTGQIFASDGGKSIWY